MLLQTHIGNVYCCSRENVYQMEGFKFSSVKLIEHSIICLTINLLTDNLLTT